MQHDNVAASRLEAVQHVAQMIECVNIANRNKDVAGPRPNRLGGQFALQFQVELIKFGVGCTMRLHNSFGDSEDREKNHGETDSRERGDLFGEKIDDAEGKERERNEAQA